ncbi:MAG: hypothetical protein M0R80_09850 [Proteobacteria bacterium]|jgi:hypothetical protein|nr:hypothetical protein [Pseudomonadota bacterium]
MKYHVEPCPECGAGDADEDCNGVGLIIGFHPQDPTRLKLPGTIFFIGCNKCQYVGPIVLCPCGINEKKITDAWNEHIKPGSTISTEDLVQALSKRKEICPEDYPWNLLNSNKSEELPEWILAKLQSKIDEMKTDETVRSTTRICGIKILGWVLSLKKPGEEDI